MIRHTARILFFICLSVTVIHAQQRFKGGITGGFNFSQIDGDDLIGFNKPGFNAGGYVSAILSDRWQLSMELLYSQQGSKQNPRDGLNAPFDKIALNFVEVPILINFLEWKFHVHTGVSYARLIDAEIIDITGVNVTDNIELNQGILSYIVGVTYFSNEKLGFNFRWFKALNDLQAKEGTNKWLGRSFSLRILYLLN